MLNLHLKLIACFLAPLTLLIHQSREIFGKDGKQSVNKYTEVLWNDEVVDCQNYTVVSPVVNPLLCKP